MEVPLTILQKMQAAFEVIFGFVWGRLRSWMESGVGHEAEDVSPEWCG